MSVSKENEMEQIFDIRLQFYVNTDFTLFGGLFLVGLSQTSGQFKTSFGQISQVNTVVIVIKTDGIKTVNRNPPGHFYSYLCPGELGIILFDTGGFRALNSGAVISPNHLSNGSK